jgi:hypothetical protein
VEKVALLGNLISGTRSQALQLRLKIGKIFAVGKAKVLPHLEARVRVGLEIPHSNDSLSLLMVQYSKDTCLKEHKKTTTTKSKICRGWSEFHFSGE